MTAIPFRRPRPTVSDDDDDNPVGWAMEDPVPRPSPFPAVQRIVRRTEWAWIATSVLISMCLCLVTLAGTAWVIFQLVHSLK